MKMPIYITKTSGSKNLWDGGTLTGTINLPATGVAAALAALIATHRAAGTARIYVVDKTTQDANADGAVTAAEALYDCTYSGSSVSTTRGDADTVYAKKGPNELTQQFRCYAYFSDTASFNAFLATVHNDNSAA